MICRAGRPTFADEQENIHPCRRHTHFINMLDTAIIGGASAGLAAALTLGRSARRTIVFDTGAPRNLPAAHAQNFFTRDGTPPLEILAIGREQLRIYPSVEIMQDKVTAAVKKDGHFQLSTASGKQITARSIILATGVKDVLPDIEGVKNLWGNKIIHCPYCHGWENKDKPVAIVANGEDAFHYAMMVHNLNKELVILTNGKSTIPEKLPITVIEKVIQRMEEDGEGLKITFADGSTLHKAAVYMRGKVVFQNELAQQLGCELTEAGSVKVDASYQSTIPYVFAAGDLSHPGLHQVSVAATGGHIAAAVCNGMLCKEDFEKLI